MQRFTGHAISAALLAGALAGCAATQVRENTLEMVDSVSRIRDVQVLRNIAAAISDHDMVPTQILLSTGQASVSAGASPTVRMPHFDLTKPASELDVGASDSWSAQWQVSPVTNSDDLRRLRNLYVLIVSTDEQYNQLEGYYNRHPEMRAPSACYGLQVGESAASVTAPGDQPAGGAPPAAGKQSDACPPGYGAGQIPKWREALVVIEDGDSIGCKLYQEEAMVTRKGTRHDATRGIPFHRWLYWRRGGGEWLPSAPETQPEELGTYGGWQLATTSRACFNDFVILAQAATPQAATAGAQGARVMLSAP
ncbi:MAG: hypothetical protein ACHP84_14180 [Caulobacterales bacterium]